MNKKVLTVCAAMLLSGSLSMMYATDVKTLADFKADATTHVVANAEDNVITFLSDITLDENTPYLVIDQSNVLIDGNYKTLNGRLVITGENVQVKNLTINNTVKVNTGSYTKNAITVVASKVTLTNNTINCAIAKDAVEGAMANGIVIFPTAEKVSFNVKGNKINNANSVASTDNSISTGLIIAENVTTTGDSNNASSTITAEAIKDFDISTVSDNKFKNCAVDYTYSTWDEEAAHSTHLAHITPMEKNSELTADAIQGYINSTQEVVFNGSSKDFQKALGETKVSNNVVVVCNDANLLYGEVKAPNNGKPSNIVADGQTSAAEAMGGNEDYALLKSLNEDDYFMFGFYSTGSNSYYVVGADNKAVVFDEDYATDPEYLWKAEETVVSGIHQFTFTNKATGEKLVTPADGNSTGKDGIFTTVGNTGYNNGFVLELDGVDLDNQNNKSYYWGLYESGAKFFTADFLSKKLGDGFDITIYDHQSGKNSNLKGNSPFAGILKPVNETTDGETFQLMNGNKYVVLDTEDNWSESGTGDDLPEYGFKFKLVSAKELSNNADQYESWFQVAYKAGENTNENANAIAKTEIEYITVGGYYISTYQSDKKDYLTVASNKDNLAVIKFGGSNLVKGKDLLLGYVTIKVANTYKRDYKDVIGKYIGSTQREDSYLDVAALDPQNVDLTKPEGQWAVTLANASDDASLYTFTNRESHASFDMTLYKTDEKNVYAVASYVPFDADTLRIEAADVKAGLQMDGYFNKTVTEVQDHVYTISAASAVEGVNDLYTAENHAGKHLIGLTAIAENATEWILKPYTRATTKNREYTDSVYVFNSVTYYDAAKSTYKNRVDTLAMIPYEIINSANNEPLVEWGSEESYKCEDAKNAEGDFFVIKEKNGKYNLVNIYKGGSTYYTFNEETGNNDLNVRTNGEWNAWDSKLHAAITTADGRIKDEGVYEYVANDMFNVTEVASPEYRKVAMGDTIRIYRNDDPADVLYEKGEFFGTPTSMQFDDANPALFVDTAYVNRPGNNRWEYLLAVNAKHWESNLECNIPGHPKHEADTTTGRFLVNLMDSAYVYGETHVHDNKFINDVDGEDFAKLGFVEGYHTHDTLYLKRPNGKYDAIAMDREDATHSLAKFAFRYVDNEEGSFVIETGRKDWNGGEATSKVKKGYLKWLNGTIVVVDDIEKAEIFNLNEDEDRTPTANETIAAEGAISVVATDGAVIIKGAEGKNVVIATILGKVVANETINSDNETIAVPAGIAVVSVDGESFKVVVK